MAGRALQITRRAVLGRYRQILRLASKWAATEPEYTEREKKFIRREARMLFVANKTLQDPEVISLKMEEAEQRMELAIHYNNPYPRVTHIPHNMSYQSIQDYPDEFAGTVPTYLHSLMGQTDIDPEMVINDWTGDEPRFPSRDREEQQRMAEREKRDYTLPTSNKFKQV
eukprot:TRINITY_DN5130_c0_g2_i1.p1 TRINITY_DN5130_c0_g2~~TRINITY_DN5130_c0_g2_i1.p1  ORF type:complete len:169 (+),score=15.22 TRINITY_DN5130_c0_g2_i1:558-1064(+)